MSHDGIVEKLVEDLQKEQAALSSAGEEEDQVSASATSTARVHAALLRLQAVKMTRKMLEATRCGRAVNALRKLPALGAATRALARSIVKKWKRLVDSGAGGATKSGMSLLQATPEVDKQPEVDRQPVSPRARDNTTISVTFGDRAENHHGMQMIGTLAEEGFNQQDLEAAQQKLEALGCTTELIALHPNLPLAPGAPCHAEAMHAFVLVVRGAVGMMMGRSASALYQEQRRLKTDKKAKMRGRVVNKHARYNLCFGEQSQEPDYEAGKGTVVAFDAVPLLKRFRACLPRYLGAKAEGLQGELNRYYDKSSTGIGFHGDSERKLVASILLHMLDLSFRYITPCGSSWIRMFAL